MSEVNYVKEYNAIGSIVGVLFPTCEVTVTDMVRLLVHENRTLRLALGLPTYQQVLELDGDDDFN